MYTAIALSVINLFNTDNMETSDVLQIAKGVCSERKVTDVVVASTKGSTGLTVAKAFKELRANVVVVAHSVGFREANTNEFPPDTVNEIKAQGGTVLFSTMPFHTINDAVRAKTGSSTSTLIADTLRMMGQGTKVCVEIVAMACDAGLVQSDKAVLAIAGTGRGADTVLLIKSANSRRFFDLKILDVIAKPVTL
jgi:hypothetical protein